MQDIQLTPKFVLFISSRQIPAATDQCPRYLFSPTFLLVRALLVATVAPDVTGVGPKCILQAVAKLWPLLQHNNQQTREWPTHTHTLVDPRHVYPG